MSFNKESQKESQEGSKVEKFKGWKVRRFPKREMSFLCLEALLDIIGNDTKQ
jgi:hypothetical protein